MMLKRKTKLLLLSVVTIVGVQVTAFGLLRWSRPRAIGSALVSPEPSMPPSSTVPPPPPTGVAELTPVASGLLPDAPGAPGARVGREGFAPRGAPSPVAPASPGVAAVVGARTVAPNVVAPALAAEGEPKAPAPTREDPVAVPAPSVVARASVVEPPPAQAGPARSPSSVEAPALPAQKAATPRTTAMGRADVGKGLFAARCTSCHALSPRHYSRAQWTSFFASGRHDRDERLGDRVTVGEIAAIHAYVDENAADSARDEGAGIR